ncbi:MFS multidrug transporter [Lasiodiplodia theobromae]|uniref:MFS multidrug transporter n=1 Tax=Lasiodiplodia theobromae TaxID=45133 RepID=UPI0015C3C97A|nr:MFS multidrug transporter [Lasiodiplodia theobromae]KAF4544761.1 MFS multidrug transporter [Lasiodiplodia theobromae]
MVFLFLFQSFIVQSFQTNYSFGVIATGLIQLALSVGTLIGTTVNPVQDTLYLRSSKRSRHDPGLSILEARLSSSVPGSLFFTAGVVLIWWVSPSSGLGIYSIYLVVVNYLAKTRRNTFGAFLPLAIQSLFRDLGFQWADRLLGFVRLALSAAPLVILWKGEEIRRRSLLMCKATFVTQEEEWGKSLLGA